MEIKHNVVGWFEIPVNHLDRAIKFYEEVFGFKLSRNPIGELDMAWFPWIQEGIGASGSLVYQKESYKPSPDGVLVYMEAFSGDLAIELSRVEAAGGRVVMPKKLISEGIGYMGLFLDSEGNRIAVHSRK